MSAFGGSGGLFGTSTSPFSSVPFGGGNLQNSQNQNVFGQPKPVQWNMNATNSSLFPNNNTTFSAFATPTTTTQQAPAWNANNNITNSFPFGGNNASNFNNNNNSSQLPPAGPWNSNTNTAFQSAQPNVTQQPVNAFAFPGSTFAGTANCHVIPLTTPFGTGLCYFESAPTLSGAWSWPIQIPQAANFQFPFSYASDICTDIHSPNRNYKDEVLANAGISVNPTWTDWEIMKLRLKRNAEEIRQKAMENSNDSYRRSNYFDCGLHRSMPQCIFTNLSKKSSLFSFQNDLQSESASKILDEKQQPSAAWKTIKSSVITEREFSPLKQNNKRSLLDVGDSYFYSNDLCNNSIFKGIVQTGPPKRTYSKTQLSSGVTIIPDCIGKSLEGHLVGKRFQSVGNLPHFYERNSNGTQNTHQEFIPVPVNISTSTNDSANAGLASNCCGEGDYLYQRSGVAEGVAQFSHEGRTLRSQTQTMRPQQKTVHGAHSSGQTPHQNCGVKLTMNNCYCYPDIATLDTMMDSANQLCLVKDFEVGHYEYGKAVFDGIIDVSGVNLDEIVKFSPMVIDIYPEGSHKPPYGEKLHCPVTITLYNIYPKVNGTPIKDPINLSSMQFDKTLMSACEKFKGVFVSYNMDNGDWVFKVHTNMT